MACRKRLQNKETFKFVEDDVLPPGSPSGRRRKSVQDRLVPKAGGTSTSTSKSAGEKNLPKKVQAKVGLLSTEEKTLSKHNWLGAGPSVQNNNNRYLAPRERTEDPDLDRIVAKLKALSVATPSISANSGEKEDGPGSLRRPSVGPCLCERDPKLVLCQLCGATTTGRLSLSCSLHPLRRFLQDINNCPACKADLANLKEFDLPPGMEESIRKGKKTHNY